MPEVSFKLNILPVQGLTFNQTLGYELRQWEEHTYTYKTSRGEIENARKGTAYLGFSKTENINAEGYGSFIRSWDKHNLNAMVGYSYYEGNGESFNMTNYDFSVEGVKYWDIGTGTYLKKGLASMGSSKNVTTKLFSYFGRVNYDYDNRYLLSASLRRESSSKFMKQPLGHFLVGIGRLAYLRREVHGERLVGERPQDPRRIRRDGQLELFDLVRRVGLWFGRLFHDAQHG